MPIWNVLAVVALGGICLALALATLVVPLALTAAEHKWLWFAGLLVGTAVMGGLFALFLWNEDRHSTLSRR